MTLFEKARESLAVARLAHDAGHYNRAASNAYFAGYQAVRPEFERLKIPPLDTGWTEGERWEHQTVPVAAMEYLGCPVELVEHPQDNYQLRVTADYTETGIVAEQSGLAIQRTERILQWVEEEVTEHEG